MELSKTVDILIVEDEGDVCLILNLMLKKDNIEIEHVNTLAKADEFLKDQKPRVIIMDNQLPDGLGVDHIKKIKSDYPAIKIIMITGNTAGADKATALQNGADIFLAKPFSKEQIQAALASISITTTV